MLTCLLRGANGREAGLNRFQRDGSAASRGRLIEQGTNEGGTIKDLEVIDPFANTDVFNGDLELV